MTENVENQPQFLTCDQVDQDADKHPAENGLDDTTETLYTEPDRAALPMKTPERPGPNSNTNSTPAMQRLHRTLNIINVHSPSDNIMSPCSQRLANRMPYSVAQNLLRRKLHSKMQHKLPEPINFGGVNSSEEEKSSVEERACVEPQSFGDCSDTEESFHTAPNSSTDAATDLEQR